MTTDVLWQKISTGGNDYRLTRFVILRFVGFIYAIAFLVAINQLVPLIGANGLAPSWEYLGRLHSHFGSRHAAMLQVPTLFWFGISDTGLLAFAWIGFGLSLLVLAGYANAIVMTILWAIYMSIVHIGQIWYGYGWETQLLETGFLAIFLCPLFNLRPFPKSAPPLLVIWLFRWLGFRIMLGSGLIKLRGDSCWRDLTCLYYHYETQPIPNPISRYLHFAPHWLLKFEVLWNHFVELIVPWFSFGPRAARHIAGILLVTFQIFLIISGNLSFLNYLTIIPFLASFDDTFWRRILPAVVVRRCAAGSLAQSGESTPTTGDSPVVPQVCRASVSDASLPDHRFSRIQSGISIALTVLIAWLSITPVTNLISNRQLMNASFDPLDLVNTYGAFGSVGKERFEIIFEGTADARITGDTVWKEYEFKAKPGDPNRRPPIIAPYQPRIDWQIWFAAMASPADYPWVFHFVWKLLHNDGDTLSLIANNPFPDAPPHYIRARLYHYSFAPIGEKGWWRREEIGEWLPPLSTDNQDFRALIGQMWWLD